MSAPDHTTRAHSKLGASSSHRWMACPGSIRLSAGIPDRETIFAAEGTAAHELGEICLRDGQDAIEHVDRTITVGNHQFVVDEEMAEAVQVYLDTIRADYDAQVGDVLMIEHRFDLSDVHEGMFGTNDACVYKAAEKKLIVVDYKHGKGYAVSAEANPQLLYYGLGAARSQGFPLETIELVIVQPRAPHKEGSVRRWSTDILNLLEWAGDLKDAAVATQDPAAPLAAGDWCKFCPASSVCPALREQAVKSAQIEFADTPLSDLSIEQLVAIKDQASLIEGWIKAVHGEVYRRAEAGEKVPGWKLVRKRSIRKWAGEIDDVAAKLTMFFDLEDDQVIERKLRSPAQIEKLIPKAQRPEIKEYLAEPGTGTTLARETDRRPEVAATGAAEEFDPVEGD